MISSSSVTDSVAPIGSAADFARALAEETGEIEALLALLRDEQQALQARDMERVYSFATAKNNRLARLGTLGAARGKFLAAHGHGLDHAGMDRYLESTPAVPAALSEAWRRMLAKAAAARQANAVNGRLIASELRFLGGALAVLQQTASRPVCYGADGQTRVATSARIFASA